MMRRIIFEDKEKRYKQADRETPSWMPSSTNSQPRRSKVKGSLPALSHDNCQNRSLPTLISKGRDEVKRNEMWSKERKSNERIYQGDMGWNEMRRNYSTTGL